MEGKQQRPSRWSRLAGFCWRVGRTAAIDLAAALVVWLVVSLFRGFRSPVDLIMLFSLPLFGLAVLPVFFDVGRMISVPVRAMRKSEDETIQDLMAHVRKESDKGMSQTFQFAAAGLVVVAVGFALAVTIGA